MSRLKNLYIKIGHNPKHLENNLEYLSELALDSAIEIDNLFNGRMESEAP